MVQKQILFCVITLLGAGVLLLQVPTYDADLHTMIDSSVPYIGGDYPKSLGYNGEGIVIGIIDTGIDYTHPDLNGLGEQGKVILAHNFFDQVPLDVNGHGTEVAGIISADGALQGIAPKSKLVSYKVSDDGESVSSDLIIQAIRQAVTDEVDIINISLGVNRTNPRIDAAVDEAVDAGITVIVAAGNDGPDTKTIGSPGINKNAITVGATYNNLTSSLVATLEIDNKQYQVLPMVATPSPNIPIDAKIVFGNYARERDFEIGNYTGAIVLAERGSDVQGETVYFSDKEKNAARAGAAALVVYNNEPGTYLGELIHEFIDEGYEPSIPTVSISREDGLEIRSMLGSPTVGSMHVFYNPDFIVHFSSRGPVSPFYIKPDLVAPGAFINTTLHDAQYNFTSGTSFATPHVSGAAALLLQKNPELTPQQIKSILVTTTDPVTDAYGVEFGFNDAGTGRLNVTSAFDANLIVHPVYLAFDLSPQKRTDTKSFEIVPISGDVGRLEITFDVPDNITASHQRRDNAIHVTANLIEEDYGNFGGRIFLNDGHTTYNIALLFRSAEGTISATEHDGNISFQVEHPNDWTYAKISLENAESGTTDTTSIRPNTNNSINTFENGTYWIEAKIDTDERTIDAWGEIVVGSAVPNDRQTLWEIDIPPRQMIIIVGVMVLVGIVGVWRYRHSSQNS